jgi:peptidoglycan hydrolase-like protein with peptidoglycan-binding domain
MAWISPLFPDYLLRNSGYAEGNRRTMKKILISLFLMVTLLIRPALAQQSGAELVWVQIEAHPSLRVAQERAQLYSGALDDVNGFSLGGNWYGIVLGPYSREDAQRVLQVYQSERRIPQDSFLAFSSNFGQQFWPLGANALNTGAVTAPVTPEAPASQATAATGTTLAPLPTEPDETPAEARQSERLLSEQERKDLQIALAAGGYYTSGIDGAFGPGTRASMRAWQEDNGFEGSGILTTLQRRVLMDQYNAPLISVGMARHTDLAAGIEIQIPAGEVRFARYEAPFAQFDSSGDLGARLLLISQPGTQATLFGLYDIMQTLEIVPLEGPRERRADSFTLEGRNSRIVSYTEARLDNGQIKGFTLIWPAGDEARRTRVLAEMKASFTRLEGVLDPGAGGSAEQNIDLISGLEVRKPRLSRSGFFVDGTGFVVTTLDAVQNCTRITVDSDYRMSVAASDSRLGVAVLRPAAPLAPLAFARLRADVPRLQSDIAVAGYSYGGALGAPTLTFGTLADIKGLNGEAELQRLTLNALPGDVGGPVIDISGGVVGMLLPQPEDGRQLPQNVSLALDATALSTLLQQAGVNAEESTERGAIPPAEMNRIANGMTVLVSCWD